MGQSACVAMALQLLSSLVQFTIASWQTENNYFFPYIFHLELFPEEYYSVLFLTAPAIEGCLNLQLSSLKKTHVFHLGFSPYIFEHGGTLNSGYGKISTFAPTTIFPTATPAGTVRTLQLVTKVASTHFTKSICALSATLK